jgi:hypothetical protein
MGSVGDAYYNAMCESFFATLECELLERRRLRSQTEARMAIFSFIESCYNPRRRHSGLGYLSPIAYEEAHARPTISAVATDDRASNRCCQDLRTDAAVKGAPAARRFAVFEP